ncbi:ABC transporter substrate-binding protein [Nocardioides sp. LHG3406-4]|uniref:ABC transporter substrate-binding protein n=1 Tax=Nocardioides sp. LHG3406-4 TaxID=2804575 RepID=UPI003CE90C0B
MRIPLTAAAAAALVLLLAGCSDSGDEANADTSGSGLEKTELKVGVLPLADYAAVYWAKDHGFFEDAGLDVTLEPIAGGPVGIQSAVAGDIDCSFANTIATLVAQDGGVPVDMVALSSALGDQSNVIMVADDSPIKTIEDLDGATIGVNTTNNVGDVAFYNLLDDEGIDIDVDFVEVPFGEMIDGVKAGSIDATHTPEPFRSAALGAGLREVVDLTTGPNKALPAAAFVCGSRFVDENPKTTKAFAEAIYAAGGDLAANEDELRDWLPGIADVPAEVAANMKLPTYFDAPNPDEVGRLADLLAGQNLIGDDYDVDAHFYQP